MSAASRQARYWKSCRGSNRRWMTNQWQVMPFRPMWRIRDVDCALALYLHVVPFVAGTAPMHMSPESSDRPSADLSKGSLGGLPVACGRLSRPAPRPVADPNPKCAGDLRHDRRRDSCINAGIFDGTDSFDSALPRSTPSPLLETVVCSLT